MSLAQAKGGGAFAENAAKEKGTTRARGLVVCYRPGGSWHYM